MTLAKRKGKRGNMIKRLKETQDGVIFHLKDGRKVVVEADPEATWLAYRELEDRYPWAKLVQGSRPTPGWKQKVYPVSATYIYHDVPQFDLEGHGREWGYLLVGKEVLEKGWSYREGAEALLWERNAIAANGVYTAVVFRKGEVEDVVSFLPPPPYPPTAEELARLALEALGLAEPPEREEPRPGPKTFVPEAKVHLVLSWWDEAVLLLTPEERRLVEGLPPGGTLRLAPLGAEFAGAGPSEPTFLPEEPWTGFREEEGPLPGLVPVRTAVEVFAGEEAVYLVGELGGRRLFAVPRREGWKRWGYYKYPGLPVSERVAARLEGALEGPAPTFVEVPWGEAEEESLLGFLVEKDRVRVFFLHEKEEEEEEEEVTWEFLDRERAEEEYLRPVREKLLRELSWA